MLTNNDFIPIAKIKNENKSRVLLYENGNLAHISMSVFFAKINERLKQLEERVKHLEKKET